MHKKITACYSDYFLVGRAGFEGAKAPPHQTIRGKLLDCTTYIIEYIFYYAGHFGSTLCHSHTKIKLLPEGSNFILWAGLDSKGRKPHTIRQYVVNFYIEPVACRLFILKRFSNWFKSVAPAHKYNKRQIAAYYICGPGWIRTNEGARPADLQSAPFDRFGTDPCK